MTQPIRPLIAITITYKVVISPGATTLNTDGSSITDRSPSNPPTAFRAKGKIKNDRKTVRTPCSASVIIAAFNHPRTP